MIENIFANSCNNILFLKSLHIFYIFLTLIIVPGTRSIFSVVVLKLISSPLSNQIVAGGLLSGIQSQELVLGITQTGFPGLWWLGSGSGKMGRTT